VRFFKVKGDTLTIKTAPNKSPIDGREGVGILVWEKGEPIVIPTAIDPVGTGLITSLAHPAGNITGGGGSFCGTWRKTS
jgi:hypothetical protein